MKVRFKLREQGDIAGKTFTDINDIRNGIYMEDLFKN